MITILDKRATPKQAAIALYIGAGDMALHGGREEWFGVAGVECTTDREEALIRTALEKVSLRVSRYLNPKRS